MKTAGKVTFKGFTIPIQGSEPVVLDGIEIEYDASYSIGELIQGLNIIEVLPDKLANAYRKVLEYQKEFGMESKKEQKAETKENIEKIIDIAKEEVKDIMSDMLKCDIEEASATEE